MSSTSLNPKENPGRPLYLKILFLAFVFSRLIHLTRLPIFNDEAIYLDWGQRMIGTPGFAFYSLYDGKQPLEMWLFGLTNKIISDPLTAGRLVSFFFGCLSFWGIYLLAKKYFKGGFVLLPGLIYTITPFFLFYDRQALMESAVGAIGIWAFFFLTYFLEKKRLIFCLWLGGILGIGLFIKSNSIVFLLISLFALLYFTFTSQKEKLFFPQWRFLLAAIIILGSSLVILFPLLINPSFKNIILMNKRFSLTISELFSFPVGKWGRNFWDFLKIGFWHLTPPIFILGIIGAFRAFKKKFYFPLVWFFGGILLATLTSRSLIPRYLVSLLPLVTIFCALGIIDFVKNNRRQWLMIGASFVFPLVFSFFQIYRPLTYFNLLHRILPPFSGKDEYITGNTAGYGLDQVRNFLKGKATISPIYVGIRLDAGNPENALNAYFSKDPRIQVIYFDKQMVKPGVSIDKIRFDRPLYYVSRSQHLGGIEDYLVEEVRFYKPEEKSYFGIFRFDPQAAAQLKTNRN